MPPPRTTTAAPEIDDIGIESPETGDASVLVRDADVEGLAFADVRTPTLELDQSSLRSCEFTGVSAEEANLRGTLVRETVLTRPADGSARVARALAQRAPHRRTRRRTGGFR